MSTVKEFIRANFDEDHVVIPWELHATIGFRDVALMSLYPEKFELDNEYRDYVEIETSCEGLTCSELDMLSILKPFKNTKNVCLAATVLFDHCHEYVGTRQGMPDGGRKAVFDDAYKNEFLKKAWNYAVRHDLTGRSFGRAILKLNYEPEVDVVPLIHSYLEVDDRSTVREFIRANFGKYKIVIPWALHTTIRFEDIAFISISNEFGLNIRYYQYVSPDNDDDEDDNCYEYDRFYVTKLFENIENVCLMVLILNDGCHSTSCCHYNIDGVVNCQVFSNEFLEKAWDYAVKHNLISERFGQIILKLGYEPEVDIESFTCHYLGGVPTKSARSDGALHTP